MNTQDKITLAIIATLLGLVTIMGTSCSTQKNCCAYSNNNTVTAKYVKHSDFSKKRYHHIN